jgi:hypothetical protein
MLNISICWKGFKTTGVNGVQRRCEFQNLPSGQYVFKVRTKFANSLQGHTAVYSFTVLKPWYRSAVVILLFNNWYCLARIIDKAYRVITKRKKTN